MNVEPEGRRLDRRFDRSPQGGQPFGAVRAAMLLAVLGENERQERFLGVQRLEARLQSLVIPMRVSHRKGRFSPRRGATLAKDRGRGRRSRPTIAAGVVGGSGGRTRTERSDRRGPPGDAGAN